MHRHLVHNLPSVLAAGHVMLATESSPAGRLGWELVCGLVGLVAVMRVLRQPAENWSHRNWSKLAWVLAALYIAPHFGGLPIPVGAIAAIWRTRRRPTESQAPGQLPMAEGSSDWPWPWGPK